MKQKDQEIRELQKKVQEFNEKRNTQRNKTGQKCCKSPQLCKHPEKKQLEHMLKTMSTEKLHLERQLSHLTVRKDTFNFSTALNLTKIYTKLILLCFS